MGARAVSTFGANVGTYRRECRRSSALFPTRVAGWRHRSARGSARLPRVAVRPSQRLQNFFSADYSSFLRDGGVLDNHAAHQQQFSDRPAGLALTCMAQGSSTSLAHPANRSPSAHITGRPVSCIPHTQVQSQQPCCTSRAEPPRGRNAYLPDRGGGRPRLLTNLRHGTGGGCMPDGVSGGREGAS